MNRVETMKIMAVLQAAYPQFYAKKGPEEVEGIVNLWAEMFEEEPYQVVAMAVKALIKTRASTFPPGIGEINEKIMQITQPVETSAMEAWAMVADAVRNSAYSSRQEFEKLPPVVQKLVGSPAQLFEWSQMDSKTLSSVVASNFRESYNARAKHERDYIALPSSVKAYMEALAGKMDMKSIEEGRSNAKTREPV